MLDYLYHPKLHFRMIAHTYTCDARMVFTRLVICSGPRHADADIVGVVHAHDLNALTTVCRLVSEML